MVKSFLHLIPEKIIFIFLLMLIVVQNKASEPTRPVAARQKVILDTDIDSDVDDAGALAMLLNMHKKGDIDLLGVVTTSDDPYAPL